MLNQEQARTEASRDAPATSAGVRARHESSRDGHEADDGTGDAGEAERKTINAGRPRGGKRNAAEARSRESEGRSVGLAEERTGEGKNNAGGGSARRPTWYEKTGTGEAVGEREDLAELRRRAWRFQDDTQAQDKEVGQPLSACDVFLPGSCRCFFLRDVARVDTCACGIHPCAAWIVSCALK